MNKCPKCLSRKGKRECPALGSDICSVCCGEHRLESIPCPQDCPHLTSEFYQQTRRRDRAAAQGKRFVNTLNKNFSSETRRQFAFSLQADMYYYMDNGGRVEDSVVIKILEYLKGLRARILVPEAPPHPMAEFLKEKMKNKKRYPQEPEFSEKDATICLEALVRHVNSLKGAGGFKYQQEVAEFFDCLDFKADLDYDPDEKEEESGGARRSEGGLILPS